MKQHISPQPSFFRKQGIQLRAESEESQHALDPLGFCQPWTILYADTRLSFPSQNPQTIVRYFSKVVESKHDQSLTMFIRKYSEKIHQLNQDVLIDFEMRFAQQQLEYEDPRIPLFILYLEKLNQYQSMYT